MLLLFLVVMAFSGAAEAQVSADDLTTSFVELLATKNNFLERFYYPENRYFLVLWVPNHTQAMPVDTIAH